MNCSHIGVGWGIGADYIRSFAQPTTAARYTPGGLKDRRRGGCGGWPLTRRGPAASIPTSLPLLRALIDVTVQNGKAFDPQTGALAAATNVWVATELRRAGIDHNRVWPRAKQPRSLPWAAAAAAAELQLRKSPRQLPAGWGITSILTKGDLLTIQQKTVEALAEIGKDPPYHQIPR
jgi:hypothetical protein